MTNCKQCNKDLTNQFQQQTGLEDSYVLLRPNEAHLLQPQHLINNSQQATYNELNQLGFDPLNLQSLEQTYEKYLSMENSMDQLSTYADISRIIKIQNRRKAHCTGLPINAPICKTCLDYITNEIDKEAEETRRDKRSLTTYLHSHASAPKSSGDEKDKQVEELNEKIKQFTDEAKALEMNLQLMETELQALSKEVMDLNTQTEHLEVEEMEMWKDLNTFQFDTLQYAETRDMYMTQLKSIEQMFEMGQMQTPLLQLFSIGQQGPFVSINGFRIGRLPAKQSTKQIISNSKKGINYNEPIEWNEVNAGLGEVAFLLQTLALVLGTTYIDHKVIPMGSFSKIHRVTEPPIEYCLHGSDATKDLLIESYFNLGLKAFLDCLRQLVHHIRMKNPALKFPYKINVNEATIGGYSILLLKNKEVQWNKAMQYALTTLKWILTWIAKRFQEHYRKPQSQKTMNLKT